MTPWPELLAPGSGHVSSHRLFAASLFAEVAVGKCRQAAARIAEFDYPWQHSWATHYEERWDRTGISLDDQKP